MACRAVTVAFVELANENHEIDDASHTRMKKQGVWRICTASNI
jgi:hypothetical protein